MNTAQLRQGLLALSALLASCSASQAASPPPAASAPPGEVWLSPGQVREAQIQSAPVGEQDVEDTILTGGVVALDDLRTGHVFSPVTGRVVKIGVDLGAHVKKGDLLATIESPDLGSTVSDVHKATADLIAAKHDLQRKRDLFAQNAASAADVETAEDTYRTATAEIERARQKQALLHVGGTDAVTQSYSLLSPIDGEVLLRNVNPGIEVQGQYAGGSAVELFTVGDASRVWVLGDLYEADMERVRVGAPAQVTVLAYPGKVFEGKVDWVSGGLDPSTRTAKVRCTFDNPDKLLRPMMYSTLKIGVAQRAALAIPRSALLRMGEYKVVFVELGERDGRVRFERLPVDIKESDSPWLEVQHGLEAGQRVVTGGATLLSQKL
jgi:cobalt-zinc-cadmium efflux system membrane fusion protein